VYRRRVNYFPPWAAVDFLKSPLGGLIFLQKSRQCFGYNGLDFFVTLNVQNQGREMAAI